ncbi:MAG: hypothetical protein NTY60_09945 [Proteobacteria bacterium]|nr:hypothetical protein [Pseudomonadota bacterium]
MVTIDQLGLAIHSPLVTPSSRNYRPPSWPPPRDWVVVEDAQGNIISRWGDPVWRLDLWEGKPTSLNFGDGLVTHTTRIDGENADLLRLLVTWRLWGPRGARTVSTLLNFFTPLRKIVALCSKNGILTSDLMRFPAVMKQVSQVLAPSTFDNSVSELHQLLDAKQTLGFVLLDKNGLKQLVASKPRYKIAQTAYIPPRIWSYQINRLRECLEDYLEHRHKIEKCFQFCLDAYAHNYGSLTAALKTKPIRSRVPFGEKSYYETGCRYHGHFSLTAEQFGISELLGRWVVLPKEGDPEKGIRLLSSYLSLIQHAGLAYMCIFSLMRIEEASSLRADCLYWENDEKFGRIPILRGVTTKTDLDSDARWPTSPSVQIAIDSMTSVSSMRVHCAEHNPSAALSVEDKANPYLFNRAFEPWAAGKTNVYSLRKTTPTYKEFSLRYPKLFREKEMRITEEDFKIALSICPTLNLEEFQVGKSWPIAWHQIRRTSAVNMFASGVVSDSSMQYLMKHASRIMSLYYGQGHTRLCLNKETRTLVVNAMYEAMGKEVLNVLSERFVSPYGEERKAMIVVNLVTDPDAKKFANSAKKGEVFFRSMRLGGCMKRGVCEYGGVESISHCAGSDGNHPCADVLYDKEKAEANKMYLNSIEQRLTDAPADSPLHRSMEAEKRGLENYFDVINRN